MFTHSLPFLPSKSVILRVDWTQRFIFHEQNEAEMMLCNFKADHIRYNFHLVLSLVAHSWWYGSQPPCREDTQAIFRKVYLQTQLAPHVHEIP
jgi:hypothetical protein